MSPSPQPPADPFPTQAWITKCKSLSFGRGFFACVTMYECCARHVPLRRIIGLCRCGFEPHDYRFLHSNNLHIICRSHLRGSSFAKDVQSAADRRSALSAEKTGEKTPSKRRLSTPRWGRAPYGKSPGNSRAFLVPVVGLAAFLALLEMLTGFRWCGGSFG